MIIKIKIKMNTDKETKTEIKKLSKKIKGNDRMEIALKNGLSFATITRYMKGDIPNVSMAKLILVDMKAKISEKEFFTHMNKKDNDEKRIRN